MHESPKILLILATIAVIATFFIPPHCFRLDDYGWEFVGYGATHWRGYSVPQEWWIFRRPVQIISESANNAALEQ
jgi:hypothetical protein